MDRLEKLPDAVDLSHHLSELSRARKLSPLKDLQQYWGREGIISLAGGLPHPDFFPFNDISANIYSNSVFKPSSSKRSPLARLWSLLSGKNKFEPVKINKYATHPGEVDLSTALQYGLATGLPQLVKFMRDFVQRVHKPAYANWTTMIDIGNTDGWTKVLMTLCNPGDGILTSEWTYPSAMGATDPYGIKAVPVTMDGEGMRSDALLELLSTWDENERGMKRPHVMYTVPVGQNPTGATMLIKRKKEIYDICVKFDIIIIEDDPYWALQLGNYAPKGQRVNERLSGDEYIASLVPSYLRFDYQGRVVRLDSFSKTIAPGCRLGWFTCNPTFAERFERQAETSTQAPCGFGQSLVIALLAKWKLDGYINWLQVLGTKFKERRDFTIDCFADCFRLEGRKGDGIYKVYDVYIKPKASKTVPLWAEKFTHPGSDFPVMSFVPPTSGMFIWLQINFRSHPSLEKLGYKTLEKKLFVNLAEAGVLMAPGYIFSPNLNADNDDEGPGHFRLSFSYADHKDMRKAVEIIARELEDFFFGNGKPI